MAYDKKLDRYFYSKSWENNFTRLSVSVLAYNKGKKRLQVTRQNINTEGQIRTVKLGRITKEEIESLLPLIAEAIEYLD